MANLRSGRLDGIINRLDALSKMALAQPDVLSSVQEAQRESLCK